jgi:hypothetical protein
MAAECAAATKKMAAKNLKTSMAMLVMFRLGGWCPRRNPSPVLYLSCEHGEPSVKSSVTRHCPPPSPAVSGLLLPAPAPPFPPLVLLPPSLAAPVRSLYSFSPFLHSGLTAVTHPSRCLARKDLRVACLQLLPVFPYPLPLPTVLPFCP